MQFLLLRSRVSPRIGGCAIGAAWDKFKHFPHTDPVKEANWARRSKKLPTFRLFGLFRGFSRPLAMRPLANSARRMTCKRRTARGNGLPVRLACESLPNARWPTWALLALVGTAGSLND